MGHHLCSAYGLLSHRLAHVWRLPNVTRARQSETWFRALPVFHQTLRGRGSRKYGFALCPGFTRLPRPYLALRLLVHKVNFFIKRLPIQQPQRPFSQIGIEKSQGVLIDDAGD